VDDRLRCFWNATREVYELSRKGRIIAETTDTKLAMKITMADCEVTVMQEHYLMIAERFDTLVKSCPPARASGEE